MSEQRISRRKFIQASACVAGATLAGRSFFLDPGPAFASPRPVPSGDTVRMGMIGVGMQGSGLLRTSIALPGVECIAACDLYDGRRELRHPVPKPACIDLGQPLFRRELFRLHFGDDLPFDMMAWDWHLIAALMAHGVRCRHVDKTSFIFRLAKYPYLIAGPQPADA